MTQLIENVEYFETIPVRFVRQDGRVMIPLPDIARSIDYDRSDLIKIIRRHEEDFREYIDTINVATSGGMQQTICLTREGVISLYWGIDINRIKTEDKRTKVRAFRKWATTLISEQMDRINRKALAQIQQGTDAQTGGAREWFGEAEQHIRFAKVVSESAGIDYELALAVAIETATKATGIDLTPFARILPPVDPSLDFLNASQIGDIVGMTPKEVNFYMQRQGFQERVDGQWQLTESGKKYGQVFRFSQHGHSGYYIKWKRAVITDARMIQNAPRRVLEDTPS